MVQRNDTKPKWEDDGAGKIVRVFFGEDGNVQLADAALVNGLEKAKGELMELLEEIVALADYATRVSTDDPTERAHVYTVYQEAIELIDALRGAS